MISIIIPVLNEEQALPATLSAIQNNNEEHELIIVDGGSDDKTLEIAEAANARIIATKRGRAAQMNAGAALAKGEWLLFLHADTSLPEAGLSEISRLATDVQAGCFHQAFSKSHWFLKFVSWLHNKRCSRTRIMYGDQAMFIRTSLFKKISGFPDVSILEDVMISEAIVELTTPVILEQTVITSSRKFEERGIYKSFFDIFVIMSCYELRLPILRQGFFKAFR